MVRHVGFGGYWLGDKMWNINCVVLSRTSRYTTSGNTDCVSLEPRICGQNLLFTLLDIFVAISCYHPEPRQDLAVSRARGREALSLDRWGRVPLACGQTLRWSSSHKSNAGSRHRQTASRPYLIWPVLLAFLVLLGLRPYACGIFEHSITSTRTGQTISEWRPMRSQRNLVELVPASCLRKKQMRCRINL